MGTASHSRLRLILPAVCASTFFLACPGSVLSDSASQKPPSFQTTGSSDAQERRAIRAVEKLGERVEYGKGYLSTHVVKVDLGPKNVEDLELLRKLPYLKRLELAGWFMDKVHFQRVGALTNLESLRISMPLISEDRIKYLQGLSNLKELWLWEFCHVTDDDMQYLAKLKNLEVLELYQTKVTDTGLERLLVLDKLRELALEPSGITDRGIERLKKLKKLEILNIGFTDITDGCFKHLKGMTKLRVLYLRGNFNLSDKAIASFKKARPDVDVSR